MVRLTVLLELVSLDSLLEGAVSLVTLRVVLISPLAIPSLLADPVLLLTDVSSLTPPPLPDDVLMVDFTSIFLLIPRLPMPNGRTRSCGSIVCASVTSRLRPESELSSLEDLDAEISTSLLLLSKVVGLIILDVRVISTSLVLLLPPSIVTGLDVRVISTSLVLLLPPSIVTGLDFVDDELEYSTTRLLLLLLPPELLQVVGFCCATVDDVEEVMISEDR